MRFLTIVGLAVAFAIAYGIAQDLITARVCVEYFTIGHPPVFGTQDPTLLALGWGVLATWWVGLVLGVPIAICARAGRRPKLVARDLVRPLTALLLVMGILSLIAGIAGYHAARSGAITLLAGFAKRVPTDRHHLFLADLCAHNMAYATGFIGGVVLCVRTWRRRGRLGASANA